MDVDVAAVLVLLFVVATTLNFAVDEWVMRWVSRWFGERDDS